MQIARGEPESAIENAIEAVALDQFLERSYQELMRAYAATGDKPKAIGSYYHLNKLLADELGANPSPETQAVYLEMLR